MTVHIGKLYIYPSAIFLPALIYLLNAGYFVALTAIAIAVHEIGHFIPLLIFGGKLKRLKLWAGGVSMVYGGLGYTGEAITALMGPVFSVLLALSSSLFGRVFLFEPAYHLAGLSLLFAIFNLVPVFPLDGGKALFSIIAKVFCLETAERVRKICSFTVLCVIGVTGAVTLWISGNPTIFLASVFLSLYSSQLSD